MKEINFYNRGQSLIGIIIVLVVVGLFAGGLCFYLSKQIPEIPEEIPKVPEIIEEPIGEPDLIESKVYLSSSRLSPGDTLVIKIETDLPPEKVKGSLNLKPSRAKRGEARDETKSQRSKIDFSKIGENLVGIVGISVKEKPGKYNLVINFPDGNSLNKELNIIERKFPVIGLPVTEIYTPSKIAETFNEAKPILNRIFSIYTPELYFKKSFIYPLKEIKIVGPYGVIRQSGDFGYQHLGVDLEAEVGTPVASINDGEVLLSENFSAYGKTLIIDHGLGISSFYCHLTEFKVLKGEKVKRGDIIALSGSTGYSTMPHLHLGVRISGASVDPLRFIETIEKELK